MMGEYDRERRDEREVLHQHERDHLAHHARQVERERERDYFAAQHAAAASGPGPGPRRLERERERDPREREREMRMMSDLERERERERDMMIERERERERDGVLRRDSLRGVEPGRTGPSYNGNMAPGHGLPAPPSLPGGGPPLLSGGMHPPPVGIHAHPGTGGMFPPSAAPTQPPVGRSGSALPASTRPPPPDPAHPYAMPHPVHPSQNPATQLYPSAPGNAPSGAMPPPPGALVDPLRERERERDRREREYAAAEHRERGRERDRIERERERERNLHLQQQQEARLLREREREALPRETERTAGIAVGTPLIPNAVSAAARAGSHAPSLGGGSRVGGATTPAPGNAGVTTAHSTPIHQSHHHHTLRVGALVVPPGPAPNGRVTPSVNAVSPRVAPPPGAGIPLAPPGLVNGAAPTGPPVPPVPSIHAIQAAIAKGTEAPLHALAQANEQTWLLIGMSFLPFSAPKLTHFW